MTADQMMLDHVRELLGKVYVHLDNERAERELTLAKVHIDNARAALAGLDPDTLTHIVQA